MQRIAHRGRVRGWPENCVESVPVALSQADGLEVDVRLAADGVPVLMHDASIDRTTDGSGPVEVRTASELARFRVSGRAPIPSLTEYLDAATAYEAPLVILDIKDPSLQCLVATLRVSSKFPLSQCMFAVRGNEALSTLRELAPTVRLASLGVAVETVDNRVAAARASAAEVLFIRHGESAYRGNRAAVATIRAHGFHAGASTLSTFHGVELARADGCDFVLADLPLANTEEPPDAGSPATSER